MGGLTHINIGSGIDQSIKELSIIVRDVVGFVGEIKFNATKPDGTPRKLQDISRLQNSGWKNQINFRTGLSKVYNWYTSNIHEKH